MGPVNNPHNKGVLQIPDDEEKKGSLWDDNSIQFPRLLSELWAVGALECQLHTENPLRPATILTEVANEMDLDESDVMDLFERAGAAWNSHKQELFGRRKKC